MSLAAKGQELPLNPFGGYHHWRVGCTTEARSRSAGQLRESVHSIRLHKVQIYLTTDTIENNSKLGDTVYEPFSGSGTTIIADEMTGRRGLAIELNPVYVDLAVKRWQEFTGKKATRESDGVTFDAVLESLQG